jgi:hypothetical protein
MRAGIAGAAGAGEIVSTALIGARVQPSSLVARIAGGDRSVWASSSAPPVTLSAATSFDPDTGTDAASSGALLFTWSCRYVSNLTQTCPNFPPAAFSKMPPLRINIASSSSILVVPSWLLAARAEPVQFTVRINKDARSATSSSIVLAPISAPLPFVDITISVPTQGGTSWMRITPSDQVSLAANLTEVSPVPISYNLQWVCMKGNLDMSITSNSILSSTSSPNLVIAAGSLKPGALYMFTLIVRSVDNPKSFAMSNSTFSVTQIPSSGR